MLGVHDGDVTTRTRSSSHPTSSSAARAPPACSSSVADCSPTRCRRSPAAGRCRYVNPARAQVPRPTSSIARRAAPRPSSNRSGPGLVFQLKEAVGADAIEPHEERFIQRAIERWRAIPTIEVLGNPDADRLSHRLVRHPFGEPLPAPQLRGGAAQRPVRNPGSRAAVRAPGPTAIDLLGIDLETSHRVRRRDPPRLRGHQAGMGPGELQLLHLRGRLRVHRPRRRDDRRPRLDAAAVLHLRSQLRHLASSRRPRRATTQPARHRLSRRLAPAIRATPAVPAKTPWPAIWPRPIASSPMPRPPIPPASTSTSARASRRSAGFRYQKSL